MTENGLVAFSGLCHGLGGALDFNQYNFSQYLFWAFASPEEKDVVRLACSNISDIALALGDAVETYLDGFMQNIFNILNDPRYDRSSKI